MTTTTDVPGVTDLEAERGHAVAMLGPYSQYRAEEKEAKKNKDMAGGLINGYLDEHPTETLTDGEGALKAFLQARPGRTTLNAQALPPELLQRAVARGLLQLNGNVWKTMEDVDPGLFLDLKTGNYIGQGKGSTSLQVVKETD